MTPGTVKNVGKWMCLFHPGIDDAHASATPALCAQARLPIGKSSHPPTSIHGLSGSLIAKVRALHIGLVATYKAKAPQTQ